MNTPEQIYRRMMIVMSGQNHPLFIQKCNEYKDLWKFVSGLDMQCEIINLLEYENEEQEEHF